MRLCVIRVTYDSIITLTAGMAEELYGPHPAESDACTRPSKVAAAGSTTTLQPLPCIAEPCRGLQVSGQQQASARHDFISG
jgi:hypothetical protein